MFGIDSGELLIIAVVALVVIGPKDLPRAMRTLGTIMGKARGMARHFRSGIDAMIREAELEEMERKWRDENERIMREHPVGSADGDWGRPTPDPAPQPDGAPPAAGTPSLPSRPPSPPPPDPASPPSLPDQP